MLLLIFSILLLSTSLSKSLVLFLEEFNDKRYKLRWFNSIDNVGKQGKFELDTGPLAINRVDGQGLKTEDDYRYYLLSRKMKRRYSNKNKTLVIQYQVIFPSLMECGGAYIKVLGSDFEPITFSSKTPYKIMFGPDVCGFAFEDRDLKVILNYQGKFYRLNKIIRYHISHIPQLFSLIIRPDNTYEVHVNMSIVANGIIWRDFRMLRPKFIPDRKAKPPFDWDDEEFILNHRNKPPPNIFQELHIVDPEYYINSSKFLGMKHVPMMQNPHYMKPWHPGFIKNTNFKGKWSPSYILNPNYNGGDDFYLQSDLGGVGIDVWQMTSGVIYDNILITDNEKFAKKFAKERWKDVVDTIVDTERNAKPYNETMHGADQGPFSEQSNERHQEYVDDTGQMACYNYIEAIKNMVLGPTEEQLNNIRDMNHRRLKKMKDELYSQLSPLPKYSFYDERYYNNIKEVVEDFELETRLELLEGRRLTKTFKFVTENGLGNF